MVKKEDSGCQASEKCLDRNQIWKVSTWCAFCSLTAIVGRMMKSPILRRKSIELLNELIQILQEIIGSGDEESLRRLEETIHKLDESRRKPNHTVHWVSFSIACANSLGLKISPEFSHFGNSFMSSSSPRRKIEWDQMACPHAYIKVRANRVALLTVCFVGYPRPHAWEHVPRTNSVQRTIFSDIITLVQQRTIFSWRNSYRAVN